MQQRSKVSTTYAQPKFMARCTASSDRPVCCLCTHMTQWTRQTCIAAGYLTQCLQRPCWHSRPATADLPQKLSPVLLPAQRLSPARQACQMLHIPVCPQPCS